MIDFAEEVDAGRAVELIDDDAFRPVDDEFTAAEHDGELAEIDVFFDDIVAFNKSEANAPRTPIGDAQTSALVGQITRLF